MLPAAATAIALRVNLPLSLTLSWVANPLDRLFPTRSTSSIHGLVTMAPMFYSNYRLGMWLLDRPERSFSFELSWDWLTRELTALWQPLLLGSVVVAVCRPRLAISACTSSGDCRWPRRAGQRERSCLRRP
jgi:uncharacterized protein